VLDLARLTLQHYLTHRVAMPYVPALPALEALCGVFVTLHNRDQLRGCIGHIGADRPLFRVVQECVIAAATDDTRFSPVDPDEVPDLDIEVSVLAAFRSIASVEEIEIGRHGLLLSRSQRRGLLLPQVAAEHGWDREMFLGQTCRKAGLPMEAWRQSDTKIEVFEAQVFSERLLR
jgi:AmmeMemoRadiSam system protein A